MQNQQFSILKNFSFGKFDMKKEQDFIDKSILKQTSPKSSKKVQKILDEDQRDDGQFQNVKKQLLKKSKSKKRSIFKQFSKDKLIDSFFDLKAHCKNILQSRINKIQQQKIEIQKLRAQLKNSLIQLQNLQSQKIKTQSSLEIQTKEIQNIDFQQYSIQNLDLTQPEQIKKFNNRKKKINLLCLSSNQDNDEDIKYQELQQIFNLIKEQISQKQHTNNKDYNDSDVSQKYNIQLDDDQCKTYAISLVYCIEDTIHLGKSIQNLQLPKFLINFVADFIKKQRQLGTQNKDVYSNQSTIDTQVE